MAPPVETEEHSKYSPSQLTRIIACPGSVGATEDIPRVSSEYAQEGTMLHSVMEECLNLNEYTVPELTIKKFNLDPEQTEAVQDCLDYVWALRAQHEASEDMYDAIESKVFLEPYTEVTGCEALADTYGTLDYSLAVPEQNLLYVVDWKFGKGVEVFPDTEQLKAYALGRIAQVKFKVKKIVCVIGQPRLWAGEPFKVHEYEMHELITWLRESLVPALNKALSKHPPFCPTAKGCMWCAIKTSCVHRKAQAMETATKVFAMHAEMPHKIDPEEVADILDRLPDLKKFIADIELAAMNTIKSGNTIPGYKLVAGRSIRKWKDEKKAKDYYMQRYDVEDLVNVKFKSPTQIEKVIGKKNLTEEDLDLVVKPEGKPTLAPENDYRPALKFESAEQKFASYAEE